MNENRNFATNVPVSEKRTGKRFTAFLLSLCLLFSAFSALAEENSAAVRQDNLSVTQHTVTIKGEEISYTATAGTMAMSTELGDYDMFFIAYIRDGVEDPASRPITFAYNGGPGAAALYVNIGMMGPERLMVDEEGKVNHVPTVTGENEYSILDMTDLVFIDPVGTGYSRAAGETKQEVFWNYTNDIKSVGDFIAQYVNRFNRWASPKYLAGESYGTTRTAGLCNYLMSTIRMELNGLMMISSFNDYMSGEFGDGNDHPYVSYLPTYAAAAWYHGKVAEQYREMSLESFLEEVRDFAGGEYWSALFQGSRLTQDAQEAIAERLAGYIGLEKSDVLQCNLRIDMSTFCTKLLQDQKLMIGRLDARYTGPVTSGEVGSTASDPSSFGVLEAFTDAMREMITGKLGYRTDLPYVSLSDKIEKGWTWSEFGLNSLRQEGILRDCMSRNPYLKVWVICGYYDLATPFYAAEWVYSHLFLNREYQKNLSFTYYESGHMFYLHMPSYLQFRQDAETWYLQEQ